MLLRIFLPFYKTERKRRHLGSSGFCHRITQAPQSSGKQEVRTQGSHGQQQGEPQAAEKPCSRGEMGGSQRATAESGPRQSQLPGPWAVSLTSTIAPGLQALVLP